MKTAISLPDETYAAATRRAAELGISRSEFFAVAAKRYLEELERSSLTARIDEALATASPDEAAADAVDAGRRRLLQGDGW